MSIWHFKITPPRRMNRCGIVCSLSYMRLITRASSLHEVGDFRARSRVRVCSTFLERKEGLLVYILWWAQWTRLEPVDLRCGYRRRVDMWFLSRKMCAFCQSGWFLNLLNLWDLKIRQTSWCICCGSILSLVQFLFSFVLYSLSYIYIKKNKGK